MVRWWKRASAAGNNTIYGRFMEQREGEAIGQRGGAMASVSTGDSSTNKVLQKLSLLFFHTCSANAWPEKNDGPQKLNTLFCYTCCASHWHEQKGSSKNWGPWFFIRLLLDLRSRKFWGCPHRLPNFPIKGFDFLQIKNWEADFFAPNSLLIFPFVYFGLSFHFLASLKSDVDQISS